MGLFEAAKSCAFMDSAEVIVAKSNTKFYSPIDSRMKDFIMEE